MKKWTYIQNDPYPLSQCKSYIYIFTISSRHLFHFSASLQVHVLWRITRSFIVIIINYIIYFFLCPKDSYNAQGHIYFTLASSNNDNNQKRIIRKVILIIQTFICYQYFLSYSSQNADLKSHNEL